MVLTRRGACTLAGTVALGALGLVGGYPVLVTLAAIAVGVVIAAVVVAGRRPRVAITRSLVPNRVQRDGRASGMLHVRNPGSRRQAGFTAIDHIGVDGVSVTVRSLAAGAEQSYLYRLPTGRRGRHEVGPLRLRRADVLGLARSEASIGEPALLWVYPKTYPLRLAVAGIPLHHHDGEATETSPRGSIDVREVRPYVPGDEARHLHWKATARTGQLMIRDYADPHQPRVTVLLDDRREIPTTAEFDEAVEFAASLVVTAITADHRCQLVSSGGVDVHASGTSAARHYLDALCVVTRSVRAGLPLIPPTMAGLGGGTLVVVSPAGAADDRAALVTVRPRFADLVVVTMDGSAPVIPEARVLSTMDALDAVRQWQTSVVS